MVVRELIQARVQVLCVVLLASLVGGCATDEAMTLKRYNGNGGLAANAIPRVYRLGIGDKLKITVFGEQQLSGRREVNVLGSVPMPLIGEVRAKDLSIAEFRAMLVAKLGNGYLRDPKVSVEVLNYRSIFVHGEVRSAGEFPYKIGLSMSDAIATAGGFTYRAKRNYVILLREDAERQVRVELPSDLRILPGDNIRVPERFF
ncbi:MAG: polysaccharide biosynthesis/export family protein [Pseudomonadota bacterium]